MFPIIHARLALLGFDNNLGGGGCLKHVGTEGGPLPNDSNDVTLLQPFGSVVNPQVVAGTTTPLECNFAVANGTLPWDSTMHTMLYF